MKLAVASACAVALASAVAGGLASSAPASEPASVQILDSVAPPHAGRRFTGVAVAVLEEGARLYRAVSPTCPRGEIRPPRGRRRVPVDVLRVRRDADGGGSVRSITICTWRIPRGVRGKTFRATVVIARVGRDGTTSREGHAFEWIVR